MSRQKTFKPCVSPCPRFITGGDTHELCVECLGFEHAKAALKGDPCEHCLWLSLKTLNSRAALFDESGKIRQPHGSGPATAEAARRLRSWGSQMDVYEGVETASAFSQPPSSIASGRDTGARMAASPAPSLSLIHI